MTIIEALSDPSLLRDLPAYRDLSTWRAWLVYEKAKRGYPLTHDELDTFRRHTGRGEPRPGGYPGGSVAVSGRQSGKTEWHATTIGVDAATAENARCLYYPIVAQDARSAMRAAFAPVRALFELPMFRPLVVAERQDSIELTNGATIAVYPARPAAIRGIRAAAAYVDELAFMITSDGRPADVEMLRAIRPCLATTGGLLPITSSPYGQSGALWELYRAHYGREDSSTLVWQASAPEMNPTLPADYLHRMALDDPEAYRSEVRAEFRTGISTLFDPDALDAVVPDEVRERVPEAGQRYVAFVDAASGSGKDAFAVAVAHLDGDRAVLDCIRAWRPPFDPSSVIAEAAALLKSYGLGEVTGDRYAGGAKDDSSGFVGSEFRKHGVLKRDSDRDRSAIYLELLPALNAGRVLLLDDPELLRVAWPGA